MPILHRIADDESGQDMIEYALLLGFISVVMLSTLIFAGQAIVTIWTALAGYLQDAAAAL